jgi:hypothetical protein
MPEPTIDAAVEQVVKTSGDPDALLAAVRSLADALGYQLTAKPLPLLHVGNRVRLLRDLPELKAGTLGEVVDLCGKATVDVLFDGRPYPMLYGREDVELAPDGDRGTCAICGGEIHYWEYTRWNGVEDEVLDSHWSHAAHPADGHDAEIGGPA